MKDRIHFFLIIILILFFQVAQAAAIYKWVDEEGQVHYGNKAPENNAQEIKIKKSGVVNQDNSRALSTEERVNRQKKYLNALETEEKSIKAEKLKKEQQQFVNNQRCNQVKDDLRTALRARGMYELNEQGKRQMLSDEKHQAYIAKMRKWLREWCE